MKLNPEIRPNLTLRHFQGGHMFYTWDESRQQWFAEMKATRTRRHDFTEVQHVLRFLQLQWKVSELSIHKGNSCS